MLDPRWRKVVRDAMHHKARTLLVALAIAVGLAGAGTILNAWALVQRVTRESYLASNPVSATIRTDSVDGPLLEAVRRIPGVKAARARRAVGGSIRARAGRTPAVFYAYDDYASRAMETLVGAGGSWPVEHGSIAIELSSTDFSGISLNDDVAVTIGDGPERSVHVGSLVRDVGLAPGWMEHIVYVFVTPPTLATLGGSARLNDIQLLADAHASQDDVRRVAYAAKETIEARGHPVRDIDVPVPGEHIHAAQMDSLLYTQAAFGVLALVVCGFLVVNLVAAMLAGQVREIGVMKTLGARPAQLARMYLAFAAALGLVASIIAIPIAVQLGREYGALKAELMNFDVSGFAIPWWSIAIQVVVGVLVPVFAAAIPIRHGCNASVASALRDFGLDRDRVDSAADWTRGFRRVSRPTLLSIRNAFRKRQRMALTLLALSTGGAVFLGAANLRRSVIAALDALYAPRHYAFTVRLSESHAADSVDAIVRSVSGVREAEGWTGGRVAVARGGGTFGNAISVTALPVGSRMFSPKIIEGRWLSSGDRELVVNQRVAQLEPSMRVGARISADMNGVRGEWTVVGIVDDGPVPSAYASRESVGRGVTTVAISSGVGGVASQVELIQRVRSALDRGGMPVASSALLEENRRVMQDHLLMVVQFLSVMGWVMLAVGGMGLASTMGLAVLERTREIGVLRAIGARHGAIARMIQTEGLVIAVASWLCAMPLSIPVSVVLSKAFSRVMLEVPILWLPAGVGVCAWLGLVVVISIVSCAWPAARASRIRVVDALAYDG